MNKEAVTTESEELEVECPKCKESSQFASNFCSHCGFSFIKYNMKQAQLQAGINWATTRTVLFLYVILVLTLLPLLVIDDVQESLYAMKILSWLDLVIVSFFVIAHFKSREMQKSINFKFHFLPIGLIFLGMILFLNIVYHEWFNLLFGFEKEVHGAIVEYGLNRVELILYYCLLPAVVEEFAFRTVIQEKLKTVLPTTEALVMTAILFSVLHMDFFSAPYLFLVGFVLCHIKEYTRSIYPCIAFHLLHNFLLIVYEINC